MVRTITSTPHTVLREVREVGELLQGIPEVTRVTTGSFSYRGASPKRRIRVMTQTQKVGGPWPVKVICPEGVQFLFVYTKQKEEDAFSLKKLLRQTVPNFQLV